LIRLSDGETLRFSYGVQYFDLRRLRKISKWPVPILFAKILHIFRFFYFKERRGWLRSKTAPYPARRAAAASDFGPTFAGGSSRSRGLGCARKGNSEI
jgi:hypothetical protein